jgi:hypothetical protein
MRATMSSCRLALVFLSIAAQTTPAREEIVLLAPAFGNDVIGRYLGTVLNLEIWRNVTKLPEEDERKGELIPVKVEWSGSALAAPSFTSAEHLGRQHGAQLVLWGEVLQFGDALLAQPFLSILPDTDIGGNGEFTWTVPDRNPNLDLSVALPAIRYRLPPIVIGNASFEKYSAPSEVIVYEGGAAGAPSLEDLGPVVGTLGNVYIGHFII